MTKAHDTERARRAPTSAPTPTTTATTTLAHNLAACEGCDQILRIGDLAAWLGESVHTLYKYSAIGYPVFPQRVRLRNKRVATTCRLTKNWLAEVAS